MFVLVCILYCVFNVVLTYTLKNGEVDELNSYIDQTGHVCVFQALPMLVSK